MKKIVRLTESDLMRIVKRIIKEDNLSPLNSPYSGNFPSISVLDKFRGAKYEVVSNNPSVPTRNFKINDVSEGNDPYLVDIDVTEIGGGNMTVEFNCNNKSMTVKPSYLNQNPKQINVSSKWVSDKMWDLYCKPAKK